MHYLKNVKYNKQKKPTKNPDDCYRRKLSQKHWISVEKHN